MKKKLLFVDDEPMILAGIRRLLRPMRDEWIMEFAGGGKEALEKMEKDDFDVIVSDMRMPGMDGAELLNEVKKAHPDTVRIVLSGHSEWDMVSRALGAMHQYLTKPCDADSLKSTIGRALYIRDMMADQAMKKLLMDMEALPSLPSLYVELLKELNDETSSMDKIGGIIMKDIGMTAKVLQLVNSSFFGLPRNVSNISQAIGLLGLDTIRALAISLKIFSSFAPERSAGISLPNLWDHAMNVAVFAKKIVRLETGDNKMGDDAFLAGMLHDAGKLVFASNFPEKYSRALESAQGAQSVETEMDAFGLNHADVGAYLLGLWGMPDSIIETIAFHHFPSQSPNLVFGPLAAVHAADRLAYEMAGEGDRMEPPLDLKYLEGLGLAERVPLWSDACREIMETRKPK